MRITLILFCAMTITLVSAEVCPATDCFCTEHAVIDQISDETGQIEFLKNQMNFDDEKFRSECKKVKKELRKKWGKLGEDSKCEAIQVFAKKRLDLWSVFCTFDTELRKGT